MTEPDYTAEAKRLGIAAYVGLPHEDVLILDWWQELKRVGELDAIFSRSCYSLSRFYKIFQRPNWLFYLADDKGLKLAIWVEPFYASAMTGVWIAPRCRRSKTVFRSWQLIYQAIFSMFDNVLGVTKRKCLLTEHEKVGYTIVGCINKLLDSQPCWIVHMSKEAFEAGPLNPARRRGHGNGRKRRRPGEQSPGEDFSGVVPDGQTGDAASLGGFYGGPWDG